jgi:hypothetical protein
MAAVSQMPDVAGQKKSIRSWHGNPPPIKYIADAEIYKSFFAPKNRFIRPFSGRILTISFIFSVSYLGPTPHTGRLNDLITLKISFSYISRRPGLVIAIKL